MTDTSGPAGVWHLNDNGYSMTITVTANGGGWTGSTNFGEILDSFSWDAGARLLQFRRVLGGSSFQWYRVTVIEGVLAGRFSQGAGGAQPPLTAYVYHVTGWNRTYLDTDIVPRTWDLLTNGTWHCKLRIDRTAAGALIGTFKGYASVVNGISDEQLEEEITVTGWDGTHLSFARPLSGQTYTGTVNGTGNTISGTFTSGGTAYPWTGTRAQVLGHGLAPLSVSARSAWQQRTRAQLGLLMMAGNPLPTATTVQVLQSGQPPLTGTPVADRDDDYGSWPPNYTLSELGWTFTLPNPYGGAAITRNAHSWLATPCGLVSGEKRPAVLALNGHGGSAWQCLSPSSIFWYGDAFARRGYVVLAVDISHRNDSPLYSMANGDDPAHSNGPHPAIKAAGFNTDWEEYGERIWDAMRGLDYLLSLPYVDPARVLVTGLSMGGCATAHLAAMEPRLAMAIPAGHSPDFDVEQYNPADHVCYRWVYADFREYYDCSDLHALIAPRPLIVQTGRLDTVYSAHQPPFSGDKQVMHRSASAYAEVPERLLHYLTYDAHAYHVGDFDPIKAPPAGFQSGLQQTRLTAPTPAGSTAWQTDWSTRARTLFDVVAKLLNG